MRPILSFRINRRGIGVAVLADDALRFVDSRHLSSSRDRAIPTAVRYVTRVLEQFGASDVVCDVPLGDDASVSGAVLQALIDLFRVRGLHPLVIGKGDIVSAFALSTAPTRSQVRDVVTEYWPELSAMTSRVKAYTVDAAAAALVAQSSWLFNPPST